MPFGYDAPVELRHLRYFVTVAASQNFTRAARQLHVAQPALSRQIHDLEEELGVTLLERSPRGARLTPAGEAFTVEARAVLQRAEEAAQVARAFAQGERGELQLGYAPSPTVELLPRILHAFQGEAPGVRVVMHDLSSEEMTRGLRDRKLHVALLVKPLANALRGLTFEELCRYPLCAALPPEHRLAGLKRVGLKELADERLVVYSRSEYPEYHEFLADLFQPFGRSPPIAEELDSATSLIAAVEARRGIALVPSCLACLAGPRLKLRGLQPAPPPIIVGTAYQSGGLCSVGQRFVKLLRELQPPKDTARLCNRKAS
jgi:DNA-binding transcriptional LysR family regulator